MAVYKVPQDVEADDKLIGPFSFRQFIYLIIVAVSMAIAWGLSQLFVPLAIIPLPFIVFFAALALPLRKDQPMEAYLSAVVSFYFLKSRKRFWIPDGIASFITIIPPKDADKIFTKDLNEDEANRRLDYLANLVDSHGWAIRGAGGTPDTSISTDLYYESRNSQQTPDMMDSSTTEAQQLTKQLDQEAGDNKQAAIKNMKAAAKNLPTPTPQAVKADDVLPASTLPSIEEIRKRQEATARANKDRETRDAVALANALTEEAGGDTTKQVVETPTNTSVSTPDTGTMELTREQADELSQMDDLKVSSVADLAKHKAAENKSLKDGDEVTISFR